MSKRTTSALLAAALGLGAMSAYADQPNQDLQKQLESLQAQVKELKASQATPAYSNRDVDAAVDSVVRDADRRSQLLAESGGVMAGWMDNHFTIRSADGNYSMSPGIHFQFRSITNYNQDGNAGKDNTDNGFEVSNLRFSLEGHAISKNLFYNFVWNTARSGGGFYLEEAYVRYKFADNFAVKVGQYKENIYHEQGVHDKRQLAVDRSLLNQTLNDGLSFVQGVNLMWDSNSNMRADIGFTDGYQSGNTNFQDPPTNSYDFGVHGRFEWALVGDFKRYNQFTSVGAKNEDCALVLGAGGDWSQMDGLNVYHHSADVQWNSGPWGAYAAYVGLYRDASGGGSSYDWGFLVQANYMINAQWELFGRYNYLKLDGSDSAVAHGTEDTFHEITVGVNYYLKGQNAKVTLDAGWLPNGAPSNHSEVGVLPNDGENQFYLRAQLQLVL